MAARPVRPLSHWLRLEDRLAPAVVSFAIADPSRLGLAAAGTSKFLSASSDGQFFAFQSDAPDLVANDSFAKNLGPTDWNTFNDIYIKDLQTGAVDLATIDTAGVNQASANAQIFGRPISADGRYVVFQAPGANLATGANANDQHAFVRDRVAGTTTLLSATPAGAGRAGLAPVITADGRFAAFVSTAGDLDPTLAPDAGEFNVFRRDLSDSLTRLESVDKTGTKAGAGRSGFGVYPNIFTVVEPVLSSDGRFVLFPSDATDLTADADVPGTRDLYLRDMQAGQTTIVSKGGNDWSHTPAASADLSVFAFETSATNLVSGDCNGLGDLVVRDPATKAFSLISRREPLLPSTRTVGGTLSSITPDGRFDGFTAASTKDYAPDVTFTGGTSAYIRDTATGAVTVVDLAPDGKTSVGGSNPVPTPGGRYVAFTSGSQAIVNGITYVGPVGGFFSTDVYLRDLATGVTRIVSVDPTGQQSQNGRGVGEVAISSDGRYVVFTSTSSNLVPGLVNPGEKTAVYLRDVWTNQTSLVSHPAAGLAITGNAFNVSLSVDGRYVTFVSEAADLVANDTNGAADVFQWDRTSGAVKVVSAAVGGGVGNGESGEFVGNRPVATPDARHDAGRTGQERHAPLARQDAGHRQRRPVGFVSVDAIAGASQVANFFAGNPDSHGGVRLAVKDFDDDSKADLATGAGTGAGGTATAYRGSEPIASNPPGPAFVLDAFDVLANGAFVG